MARASSTPRRSEGAAPAAARLVHTPVVTLRHWWRDLGAGIALVARAAWRGVVEFYHSDNVTHSASIAYFGLLSLFPLFLLFFSVVSRFTAGQAPNDAVTRLLMSYFPAQFDFLLGQLEALRHTHVQLGIGSALALVWAAHGVFGAIHSAVNHAWGVERPRSYLGSKFLAMVMLATSGLALLIVLLLASVPEIVQIPGLARTVADIPVLAFFSALSVRWGTTLLLIFVVGMIFYFVPSTEVRFRDVWIGAVLTGLLWRGALELFAWYLRDPSRFSWIHGSIAAVVVFLLWVYTSAVVLLYGVEFTAAYARLRRERLAHASDAGTRAKPPGAARKRER